jgi:2-dehydro-3-deoxyphosphogluconate aldolase / (4S)-4-hydroxy-2-oxoglutarate aldolase
MEPRSAGGHLCRLIAQRLATDRVSTQAPRHTPLTREGQPLEISDIVSFAPVIPVVTVSDLAHAVPLARALAAGGLRVLEITMRASVGTACIEAVRKAVPEAIVGAGNLTRAVDFAAANRAGAQFGVTPGLTPELISAARGARFPLLPGVMTPSEVIAARHAGFNVLRLFPAHQAGGVPTLQALGAVYPDVSFCPLGGITQAAAADYLALPNVTSVACSWVCPAGLIASTDWSAIEALARAAAALRERLQTR